MNGHKNSLEFKMKMNIECSAFDICSKELLFELETFEIINQPNFLSFAFIHERCVTVTLIEIEMNGIRRAK